MPKTNAKTKKTTTAKKKQLSAKPKAPAVAAKKGSAVKTGKEKQQMSKTATKTKKAAAATPEKKAKPTAKAKNAVLTPAPAPTRGGKTTFKKEITQKLAEAKGKILQEVSQKVKSESNVLKFEIGDIYDIASSERERELTLMLGDRDREKLSEIEDALERLKDNVYGACEECGEPIAENRLRALPSTRVCVDCQSRHERELKIKGGRFEEESGLGIMERGESEDEEF